MKEYIFDRTTGEFIRKQEAHLNPLESKKGWFNGFDCG